MGIINKWNKKCVFCKSKKGNVKYVPAYGMYGGHRAGNWYHKECLEDILCFPENYGHKMADMALHLTERIKDHKRKIEGRKKRLSDACEYISNSQ